MPAGVSWQTYLKFSVAAAFSMIAGAQTVHAVYKPLEDLETFIEDFEDKKVKQISKEEVKKISKEEVKSENSAKESNIKE